MCENIFFATFEHNVVRGVGAKIVFSESEAFAGAKKGDTGGERHKGLGGKWAVRRLRESKPKARLISLPDILFCRQQEDKIATGT
jgi:hypothetical protein